MHRWVWLAALLPVCTWAHHSRSAYDLDANIVVEGVVTEVAWTNPHYYLSLVETAANGEAAWTFEGHSIPGLVRNGWSKTSLQVGARVRVVANPNRQAGVAFALLDHVTRADGETFYAFRRPAGAAPAPPLPLQPATDLAGTWRLIRSLRANLVSVTEPPADWPLQPPAQAEVARFDLRDDPALRCEPLGLPRMLTWPYAQHWVARDGGFTVDIEHSAERRRIHPRLVEGVDGIDGIDAAPSISGTSFVARQADGSYQIVTRRFLPQPWGNARGISSSAQKQITERYALTDGGYKLRLSYTIEDPVYLREPVTQTAEFAKVHDYVFAEEPRCDVATATRHLQFEQ